MIQYHDSTRNFLEVILIEPSMKDHDKKFRHGLTLERRHAKESNRGSARYKKTHNHAHSACVWFWHEVEWKFIPV
jgi:hypothetical protein